MMASQNGHLDVVQALLAKGADVNAKDERRQDRADDCLPEGHLEVVQALLAKGADVNAKENDGATALMLASQNGHREVVQALLAKGADVNTRTTDGDRADWPPRKATSRWCRRCSPKGPMSMPRRTMVGLR